MMLRATTASAVDGTNPPHDASLRRAASTIVAGLRNYSLRSLLHGCAAIISPHHSRERRHEHELGHRPSRRDLRWSGELWRRRRAGTRGANERRARDRERHSVGVAHEAGPLLTPRSTAGALVLGGEGR